MEKLHAELKGLTPPERRVRGFLKSGPVLTKNKQTNKQTHKQKQTKTNEKIETSPPLYMLTVLLHFHRETEDTQCRVQQEYIQNSTYQSPCCKEYLKKSNERRRRGGESMLPSK